jgi:hypothetical protein
MQKFTPSFRGGYGANNGAYGGNYGNGNFGAGGGAGGAPGKTQSLDANGRLLVVNGEAEILQLPPAPGAF